MFVFLQPFISEFLSGLSKEYTFVEINTPRGEKIVQNAMDYGYLEVKEPSKKQLTIRSKVERIMIRMTKETHEKIFGNSKFFRKNRRGTGADV